MSKKNMKTATTTTKTHNGANVSLTLALPNVGPESLIVTPRTERDARRSTDRALVAGLGSAISRLPAELRGEITLLVEGYALDLQGTFRAYRKADTATIERGVGKAVDRAVDKASPEVRADPTMIAALRADARARAEGRAADREADRVVALQLRSGAVGVSRACSRLAEIAAGLRSEADKVRKGAQSECRKLSSEEKSDIRAAEGAAQAVSDAAAEIASLN